MLFSLLLACGPGPSLVLEGGFSGRPMGLALNPEGWSGGRVGMFDTTCDVHLSGELATEQNFVQGAEWVHDTDGSDAVVQVGHEVLLQTGGSLIGADFASVFAPGTQEARFVDGGVALLRRSEGLCAVDFAFGLRAEVQLPSELCDGGPALLPDGDGVWVIGPAGRWRVDPLGAERLGEGSRMAAWDPRLELFGSSDGERLWVEELDGSVAWQWTPDSPAEIVAIDALAGRGMVAALVYEDGSGGLVLLDGGDFPADTASMRRPPVSLRSSADGSAVAVVRERSARFYRYAR